MEILFLVITAVAVNFAGGFAAGWLFCRSCKPRPRQPNYGENQTVSKWAAEYRNFLSYDGSEQEDVA